MAEKRFSHVVRKDCPLPPETPVVAYCRDSGGDDQERSVKQQQQAIIEYCDEHKLILEAIYIDEAKQSSNSENRSELNAMLDDISQRFPLIRNLYKRKQSREKHPFGVIIWKSNRLSRDSDDASLMRSDLRVRGITLISLVATNVTGNKKIDAILEVLQDQQDETLLEEISDNTKRGQTEIVSMRDNDPEFRALNPDWPTNDGRYLGIKPGPVPVGFKGEKILIGVKDRKGRKSGGEKHHVQRLVRNDDNDLWNRCLLAWKMRTEGAGIKQIMEATRLYKSAGCYVTFFNNRIYTGDLEYGGRLYEKFVEPLIPFEWWEIEQQRKLERSAKIKQLQMDPFHEPRRVASRHLLSGLVVCGYIKGEEHPTMADTIPARGKRRRWDFYICSHKKNSRECTCKSKRINATALDDAVIRNLMENVLTIENLRPIAKLISQALHEENNSALGKHVALKGRLTEISKEIDNIVDAIGKLGYSKSLESRLKLREDEQRKLEQEMRILDIQMTSAKKSQKITDEQLKSWIENIRQALNGAELDIARKVIRQLVGKIVVNEKTGVMYYTFPFSHVTRKQEVVPTGLEPVSSP